MAFTSKKHDSLAAENDMPVVKKPARGPMIIGLIISNSLKELLAGKGREKVLYFYTPGKNPLPLQFSPFSSKISFKVLHTAISTFLWAACNSETNQQVHSETENKGSGTITIG